MDGIKFTLTYSALKMFGKQLYSNVSSAISELVANGLDAKAPNIYLTIDIRDKMNSYVEVFDEGKGMSATDIADHYIKIGYNKRRNERGLNDGKTLGRKGIGKLAALYLSDCFTIITKTVNSELTCWKLDVSGLDEDDSPQLEPVGIDEYCELESYKKLVSLGHGTIICLQNVNMKGLGDKAFESLECRLSNLFLYDKLEQKIWIKLIQSNTTPNCFLPINKQIAFKNLAYVYASDKSYVKECEHNTFTMSYKTKNGIDKKMTSDTEIVSFADTEFHVSGEQEFFGVKKHYELDGWIGIHATIDGEDAKYNDDRYIKNQFYNPNQLRVYVRNKLAMPNMIEYLGITRAFVNYIEGEISFDILDDDELEDIATAGRQDFNTQDPRFLLLKELLTKIGNSLVSKRQALADKIREKKRADDISISTRSKTRFQKDFHGMLEDLPDIKPQDRLKIEQYAVAQLEGDVNSEAKSEFTVFLSHASKDHIFSDFIFRYLVHLGFNGNIKDDSCEIFYSSNGLDTDNLTPLSILIKQYIIRKNNDILFLTSSNFGDSEFCLFEGGAAWATKSVGDYKIMALTYDSIPQFLTNGKSEIVFNIRSKDDLLLDEIKYNYLVVILNRLIRHLNKNREVSGLPTVPILQEIHILDKVELKKLKKSPIDFMDNKLVEYWNTYVVEQADTYFIASQQSENKS